MTLAWNDTLQHDKDALLELLLAEEAAATPVALRIEREAGDRAPLSAGQQRLWLLYELAPDCPAYNLTSVLRARAQLRLEALTEAVTAIVARHEILRTTFHTGADAPFQKVHPTMAVPLVFDDLEHAPPPEREAQIRRAIADDSDQPFDLAHGPALRLRVLRLGDDDYLLLISAHHIVYDAWSVGIFVAELGELYQAASRGRPASVAPLVLQYADYASWEVRQDFTPQVDYWVRALAGVPGLDLPADRPPVAVPSFRGAFRPFGLPAGLTGQLRELGRRHHATLFMTLLAAFETLLFRYTGQDDFALGVPIANRRRPEIEGVIGFFVNTLALRARLAGDPTFNELLARVRASVIEGFEHQEAPFDRVVERLHPERSTLHLPLVRVVFALQNAPVGRLELDGVTLEPVAVGRRWAKFDLALVLYETDDRIEGELEYATDHFDPDTMDRMLGHLRALLESICAAPDTCIGALPMLTADERRRLLSWNGTATDYPRTQTIAQCFERQARTRPEAVAVEFGSERLRYRELDARADRLAGRLRDAGVGAGTPVAIHAQRCAGMVVGLLAILKAGGYYVPLDPAYPRDRLALMLRDCGARVLLTQADLLGELPQPDLTVICLDDETGADAVPLPALPLDGESLAYVIYTSGSTGVPKGVAVPHRAVLRLVLNTDYVELGPDDRIAQASNTSFDAATFEIWGALLNGARLIGVERDITLAPSEFASFLREQRITTLFVTTALFNQIAREGRQAFATVRHLLFGGEQVDPHAVRQVLFRGPPQRLLHVYGPTENTTFSTWHLVDAPELATTVPIGRPIANSTAYVLDANLELLPVGVPGELYVGGDGLAHGYLGQPQLTAERFVPNPFDGGRTRLYRTGDIVRRLAGGELVFIGRCDTQVKIRGFRVELGEIEAALLDHPAVREAVVVYAEQRLVAYVVPAAPDGVEGAELRRHLAQRLPDYMVPADFGILDRLPLNANGKVDRTCLPEIPRGSHVVRAVPRTATERVIADIWAGILGRAGVGADDNFFDLGGHSLLATRVVSRVREAFGIELPLRALFESPTVAGLAQRVDAARRPAGAVAPPIRPARLDAAPVLSFAQERLWFLDQLEPGNPFYNVPIALRLSGALDVSALERSISAIVKRHEVLRTTFPAIDGRPVPSVATAAVVELSVVDLSGLPHDRRADEMHRRIVAEARESFDLAHGPLLRMHLLHLAPHEHVLLFTLHHIVADGWSLGVLVNELGPLYRAGGDTATAGLPMLPIQYRDFATWQREYLRGEVLDAQLAYWKHQLADVPPALDLPTDRPRPPAQSYRGSSVQFEIDAALADALRVLTRRHEATLFMTLLAAFATLLSRLSSQDDIVIGSPIANRTRGEIEPLIGFFVNTLALRVDMRGNPTFAELLARVRHTALDAYAHQDLPFERLVDELQPERDLSLNPLFQVMFALQNAPLDRLELSELSVELLPARHQAALFDLVLDVWEVDRALCGVLEYNTDLFDDNSAQSLACRYCTLLTAIAADSDERLDDLAWLTDEEQRGLLALGAGPRRDYPIACSLQTLFAGQAARHADRIAAVHNGTRISYGELDARANRIAQRLRHFGVTPGGFVAILDERGIDMLAAMLGVLKAGAAFVPLDPAYPPERIRYMLADSRVPVLISRSAWMAELAPGGYTGPTLLLDAGDWRDEPALPPELGGGCGHDLAYMLYTSGSTGVPKGALVRHDGAINHIYAEAELLGLDADTVFLQSAPSSSDISVWQFLGPLLIGARTVIADYATVCDAAVLFETIRAEGVTLIELVPIVMKALLDHAGRLSPKRRALPRLETAMVTGEAPTPALVNQWLATYPGIRLINAYGPTEAADDICQAPLDRPLASDRRAVPIGRPLANLTLYVLDRNLRLVPSGVPGEICVSGVGVGAGYWGNDARTREAFVANPYAGEDRGDVLYRTGDRGRWLPDGTLECLERIDHQVKVRGFRIELGEIEGLLAAHPAVREAVVATHEPAGGDRRLAGYIVPDAESAEVGTMLDELQREQIGLWRDLHEDSYRDELLHGDVTFNVIGWDSNYTGQPLPEAEMHEYVDFTVERIRSLEPRRVLEIGCGTGLIMFALLPHCVSYVGSDLSHVAIHRLRQLQALPELRARIPGLGQAALECRRADEVDWLGPGSVDTVVLPSVVQYFPGVDYLLLVLDRLFERVLSPGGSVCIGDVRSLPLLEAFHASVQLYKAGPSDRAATIAQRVHQRLAQEQELALDPGFFEALKQRYAAIREVQILPKRGVRHNEMTRFRYDVLIRTGGRPASAVALPWSDWRRDRPGVDALRRCLTQERPAVVALRRIANPRVGEALAVADAILRGRPDAGADELRALAAACTDVGIEPEDLWRLGRECAYRVDLGLAAGYADGSYDAVLRPLDGSEMLPVAWTAYDALKPWDRYASHPLHEKLGRRLAPELREFLKQKLPHYMVPSSFVVLPDLPLTPAGKVDRLALPAPLGGERATQDGGGAPRDRNEQALASIWSEVLGLTCVGIHDNFFELGGHSLKATQVVSRIQRELGVEVALREVFNHPTVAELAASLRSARAAAVVAIPKAAQAAHYPLSHAQRRLWVLSQLDGASAAYNLPLALLFEGPLDAPSFRRAYVQLLERHESLRTVFVVIDGMPRQRILPATEARLEEVDMRGQPSPEETARTMALADAAAPFDLERSTVRASLLRLADARHVLLLNLHHIVSDDWSLGVMAREFVRLYAALLDGSGNTLAPLRLQYRDYACWQNDFLANGAAAAHHDYWHARLAGKLPVLDLETDLPRPPVRTFRGHTLGVRLDAQQTAGLSVLARERNASLFMALAAIVETLLYRYTGQEDMLLGFPIAGRDHADLEEQIGFYVNMLPLRGRVRADLPFVELLDAVRAVATEAYEHQAYPFDRLVDELDVVRDVSRSPMFDVILVMQNAAQPVPAPDGLSVQPYIRAYEVGKYDLSFTFEARGDGLQIDITYSTDLFLPARIRRMADHLRELVAGVIADATAPVGRLPMLSAAERHHVLGLGAPCVSAFPPGDTLVTRFERQVARTPERMALVWPATAELEPVEAGPRRTLSYVELNTRANRLAHYLRRLGVGPDVRVGVCLPRSLDLIVGVLGTLKAGGAYVPLDAAHPAQRWSFMLGDANAAVVLTVARLADRFTAAGTRVICLDRDSGAVAAELASDLAPAARPNDLAYVIYTSGSTGEPKGVAVTHHNVVRLFAASEPLFGFDEHDVWTLFHSCAFDFSVWELWGALLYGGRLVIVPYTVSRAPDAFHALLARERVTVLNQTPSAFRQLIQADGDAPARDLALRYVIFGGETLDLQSPRPWFARHGDESPRLVNMYGITETTVHVTYRALSSADLDRPGSRIGRPLPDLRLCLLDAQGEPVPIGVAGEIYVGGGGVARGYLNRPELTAQRFVPDPFSADPQARLYRSGDLARFLADGDLEYLGRIDHQVQLRGFRVELGEIESVLATHPGVREAVVLADGHGERMCLAAWYVPMAGETTSADELRDYLRARLPDYMVPAALIRVDQFPLTANGKLDRGALPRPDEPRRGVDVVYVAPQSELERTIAAAFQEVVGIERVGLHDNFFDFGANSLLLVQVQRRLRAQLERDVPVIQLFQYPTVAALARQLAGNESSAQPTATQEAKERAAQRKAARDDRERRSALAALRAKTG